MSLLERFAPALAKPSIQKQGVVERFGVMPWPGGGAGYVFVLEGDSAVYFIHGVSNRYALTKPGDTVAFGIRPKFPSKGENFVNLTLSDRLREAR